MRGVRRGEKVLSRDPCSVLQWSEKLDIGAASRHLMLGCTP